MMYDHISPCHEVCLLEVEWVFHLVAEALLLFPTIRIGLYVHVYHLMKQHNEFNGQMDFPNHLTSPQTLCFSWNHLIHLAASMNQPQGLQRPSSNNFVL